MQAPAPSWLRPTSDWRRRRPTLPGGPRYARTGVGQGTTSLYRVPAAAVVISFVWLGQASPAHADDKSRCFLGSNPEHASFGARLWLQRALLGGEPRSLRQVSRARTAVPLPGEHCCRRGRCQGYGDGGEPLNPRAGKANNEAEREVAREAAGKAVEGRHRSPRSAPSADDNSQGGAHRREGHDRPGCKAGQQAAAAERVGEGRGEGDLRWDMPGGLRAIAATARPPEPKSTPVAATANATGS